MAARQLLPAIALLLGGSVTHAQMDSAYWVEPVRGPLKIRSIGGVLGVVIEDHGALGLEDFAGFAAEPLPTTPDDLSDFYFGFNSVALGLELGPRVTAAHSMNGAMSDNAWTFHLALIPRVFFLYFTRNDRSGDTLSTTDYIYTMSQTELAVGAGHIWTLFLGRHLFLQGGLSAELGNAPTATIDVLGTRTDEINGLTTDRTLLEGTVRGRGTTSLRGSLTASVGLRIGRRVDVGPYAQFGTGLMWVHGDALRSVLRSDLYALQVQFLIHR
ncbi:MAG: hypothetical protein H6595_00595 [Flavobacteriales bacterium]|nr:hypothetical protein [Flavobacteriales bacterium]MCB9165955.1 hypothetical protein [Flavobacteriales bacterium]